MKRWMVVGCLILFVLISALVWRAGSREPTVRELERDALNTQVDRAMVPFRIAFRVLLGALFLLTLGGLGWAVVRWLHRRVDTIYPDGAGLYPVREQRVGRARVFHDPNRVPTATTVYARRKGGVDVAHPLLPSQEEAQRQATAQAQAAQALRAAVSGQAPLSAGQIFPPAVSPGRELSRPLPEVKVLDVEPSHIERLLLEKGEADAGPPAEWEVS